VYHDRTLKLLGITAEADSDPDTAELASSAVAHGLKIPAAFEEWVRLGGQDTMERLNHDEAFFFSTPEVLETFMGPGLSFCQENQGCWELVALLDHGDDPPVVYVEWQDGEPLPGLLHADSFSECILAQVFDWQHMFEFSELDGAADMAYQATVMLDGPPSPDVLRQRFDQHATTHFLRYDKVYDNQRYSRSPDERLIVTVAEGERAAITILGADIDAILAVEAELLEWLGADVCPAEFNWPSWAAEWLAEAIDTIEVGNLARIRHGCREKPSPEALARLVSCHEAEPLPKRLGYGGFADMGGQEWGVRVNFTMSRPDCWRLDGIVPA